MTLDLRGHVTSGFVSGVETSVLVVFFLDWPITSVLSLLNCGRRELGCLEDELLQDEERYFKKKL